MPSKEGQRAEWNIPSEGSVSLDLELPPSRRRCLFIAIVRRHLSPSSAIIEILSHSGWLAHGGGIGDIDGYPSHRSAPRLKPGILARQVSERLRRSGRGRGRRVGVKEELSAIRC